MGFLIVNLKTFSSMIMHQDKSHRSRTIEEIRTHLGTLVLSHMSNESFFQWEDLFQ